MKENNVTIRQSTTSLRIQTGIRDQVSRFYEAFPYPCYPLLAKPKLQEGNLSHSSFPSLLLSHYSNIPLQKLRKNILVVGCGEVLPYIFSRNEVKSSSITAIDLSMRSLRRAKFRVGLNLFGAKTHFINSDIESFLELSERKKTTFDHIDAYGVLHHLANPGHTLKKLSTSMSENSTLRIMVYNNKARTWINHIQKAFSLLQLSPYTQNDLKISRKIIQFLGGISPNISDKISGMGNSLIKNDTRFVDTFFNSREARIPIEKWFDLFSQANLKPIGLIDRYAELDDLRNPLWSMPKLSSLIERSVDGRFENNFELYLCKSDVAEFNKKGTGAGNLTPDETQWLSHTSLFKNFKLKETFSEPPSIWNTFSETKDCDPSLLKKLWALQKQYLDEFNSSYFDELLLRHFSILSLKRLARIGALLPQMIHTQSLLETISTPIHQHMEPVVCSPLESNIDSAIKARLDHLLPSKKPSEKRTIQAIKRFIKACS